MGSCAARHLFLVLRPDVRYGGQDFQLFILVGQKAIFLAALGLVAA